MTDKETVAADARPIVKTGQSGNKSVWIFAGAVVAGALILFQALSAHRRELETPATQIPANLDSGLISSPPALAIPPDFGFNDYSQGQGQQYEPRVSVRETPAPQIVTRVVEREVRVPEPAYRPDPASNRGPEVIFQNDRPSVPDPASTSQQPDDERVTARRLKNPSLTVPQGTVVAAVLETALNSTQSGAARAVVSRDVMSFDGTRVLIPRGSRLYGQYQADLKPGQKRALISWQRLTRPDAVIIDLNSPAADPLGRAGVGGKVNSHFLTRFGSTILQSVLDIGVGVATRAATKDSVFIALPGSTANISGQTATEVQPTLTVKQGTSVSVFVSKDLDFSTVES